MRFNDNETQLLLHILKTINPHSTFDLLIEKLELNEYVKGRLLNLLFTEITKVNFVFNDARDIEIQILLKKIKFKATPR